MREGVDATRADRETGLSVGGREEGDGGREDGGGGLDVLAEEAGGASEAVMMGFVVSSGLLLFFSFFPFCSFRPFDLRYPLLYVMSLFGSSLLLLFSVDYPPLFLGSLPPSAAAVLIRYSQFQCLSILALSRAACQACRACGGMTRVDARD